MEPSSLCPCCSGKQYSGCCQPFHKGKEVENAEQLVRARFSAYALHIPEYIISTTHPASSQYIRDVSLWKRKILSFVQETDFLRLDILNARFFTGTAVVVFAVHLSQNQRNGDFTEKSFFEVFQGRLLYRGGELIEGRDPNALTIQETRVLPLAYYGDPILRRKADPITVISDELKELVSQMIETMEISDGAGIAAPQVHHSLQLFVIKIPSKGKNRGDIVWGETEVLINPKLSDPSLDFSEEEEGCLSIPGIRVRVKRPKHITVEYTTLSGERCKRRVSDWEARVIMHENDHIQGVLFTDRAEVREKKKIAPFLESLKQRIHGSVVF